MQVEVVSPPPLEPFTFSGQPELAELMAPPCDTLQPFQPAPVVQMTVEPVPSVIDSQPAPMGFLPAPTLSQPDPVSVQRPAQALAGADAMPLQDAAAHPVPAVLATVRPAPRRMAPAVVTPPHSEGLARLQEQRARDGGAGAAPAVDRRAPNDVVTPMPRGEQLARLRAVVNEREAARARLSTANQAPQPSAHPQEVAASLPMVRALDLYLRSTACNQPGARCFLTTTSPRSKLGSDCGLHAQCSPAQHMSTPAAA